MAFVYEEERKFEFNNGIEKNDVGPGQYLPIYNIHSHPNENGLSSFESKVPKFASNKHNTPGPGTYYKDKLKEQVEKNIQNEKIVKITKQQTIHDNQRIISPDDPETRELYKAKTKLKTNYERLGFSIKEKRFFKTKTPLNPGPGTYINGKDKEVKRITSAKCLEMKSKITKLQPGQLKDKFGNVSSIPQKDTYGYDIDKNNNLIRKENPEQYKTFTGVNGDTVGPGTYDLDFPEKWRKSGVQWAKSSKGRFASTKRPQSSRTEEILDINVNNKERPKSTNYKGIHMFKTYAIKQLTRKTAFNDAKPQIHELQRGLIDHHRDMPGPGYYYDINLHSAFKDAANKPLKNIACSHTYLGSSSDSRFNNGCIFGNTNIKGNTQVGPGKYFVNEHSETFIKNHSKHNNKANVPFASNTKRFTSLYPKPQSTSVSDSLVTTTQTSFNNHKTVNSNGTFLRKERRFKEAENEMKRLMEGPGPGSYIHPFSNTGESNTVLFKGRYVDIRKGKELVMINKRPQTAKEDVLMNKQKEFGPPVGRYNPGVTMTIRYNNERKLNYSTGDEIAFSSSCPQGRTVVDVEKQNGGPGYYYTNKVMDVKQIKAPFNTKTSRDLHQRYAKNDREFREQHLGPGKYDYDYCYSWIKKSFNVKYIS